MIYIYIYEDVSPIMTNQMHILNPKFEFSKKEKKNLTLDGLDIPPRDWKDYFMWSRWRLIGQLKKR